MPGTVIGTSLNLGYEGKVSRNPYNMITARQVKSNSSAIPFGRAVVVNTDNTYALFGDTDTGIAAATDANFAGIAVAEVKQMTVYTNQNTNGTYNPYDACDSIQQGSVNVKLSDGVPVPNAQVYICTVAGGSIVIGDFCDSATPTGGGTAIALTGVVFKTNKKDANNIVEITLTQRVSA